MPYPPAHASGILPPAWQLPFPAAGARCRDPKTPPPRLHPHLGFAKPEEEPRIAEAVSERRNTLIKAIRNAAFADAAFVFSGRDYIADASYGETRFDHALLDIRMLFYWLVNDSKLDLDWIPFQVRERVKNNPPPKSESQSAPLHLPPQNEISPKAGKRRAGRPRSSPGTITKDMETFYGWVRFKDSKAGGVKEYVEDLNNKGEDYTVDKMKKLIDRCGKASKKK